MPNDRSGFKMYGKSPMMKKLIGKQNNLPEELKAKIIASPAKKKEASKVKTTRTASSITKSKGEQSSTYNMDKSKTKKSKDGKTTSYTFTNKLGNSINETHGSSPAKKYKSDSQRKAVHASKAEKASPTKNYKKGYYGA